MPEGDKKEWAAVSFVYLDDLNSVFRTSLEILLMFTLLVLIACISGFKFGVHKTDVKEQVAILGRSINVKLAKTRIDSKKASAIRDYPKIVNKKLLLRFICICQYCSAFIPGWVESR